MIIRPEQLSFRLKRGTKLADIPSPLPPPISEINSSFQYAEYLSLLVHLDPHDVDVLAQVPVNADAPAVGTSRGKEKDLWIYEHLRRIPIDVTPLITSLLPLCTPQTCPKMKADEWQYLCTAHGPEGVEECSAIDYILHTLDSTTALMNSSEHFPSRLQIPSASLAHFPSLFRRLSRIFSHAYFHHREIFHLAEAQTSLYARFVALCERYRLIGENLLIIPKEAIGAGKQEEDDSSGSGSDEGAEEEEEEDGDQDQDQDQDQDHEATSRGRGGEGDSNSASATRPGGKDRRPHSLDRYSRTYNPSEFKRDPPPPPAPTAATEKDEDSAPAPSAGGSPGSLRDRGGEGMTMGRNRNGNNNRKARGTMLWTSDLDPPSAGAASSAVPPADAGEGCTEGADLTRQESSDTAIHLSSGEEEEEGDDEVEETARALGISVRDPPESEGEGDSADTSEQAKPDPVPGVEESTEDHTNTLTEIETETVPAEEGEGLVDVDLHDEPPKEADLVDIAPTPDRDPDPEEEEEAKAEPVPPVTTSTGTSTTSTETSPVKDATKSEDEEK